MLRLPAHHHSGTALLYRGIGWSLALACALSAMFAFSSFPSIYAAGFADLSHRLEVLRFDPLFVYAAVGVWLVLAGGSQLRRGKEEPVPALAVSRGIRVFPGAGERVRCIECGTISDPGWSGWRACRTEDPEGVEPPEISFFCPGCAYREFGRRAPGSL